MAFNAKKIFPIDSDARKAVGINLPFSSPNALSSNYTTRESIKNNLINFLLTERGEKIYDPNFGFGLERFLFEQLTNQTEDNIKSHLRSEVKSFFPSVNINEITIKKVEDQNVLFISLVYNISETGITDTIEISL